MLWAQQIKVYTDHKNLMQDALGMTSDRVYCWRLLLEEYGPVIEYIKGVDDTVADVISRLEYGSDKKTESLDVHQCFCHVATLLSHYRHKHDNVNMNTPYVGFHDDTPVIPTHVHDVADNFVNNTFANTGNSEEDIYIATVSQIAAE